MQQKSVYFSLLLGNNTWNEVLCESDEQEQGIAFHAMCPVFNVRLGENDKVVGSVGNVNICAFELFMQ